MSYHAFLDKVIRAGGATIGIDREVPTTGYMVGTGEHGITIPANIINSVNVDAFVQANSELLASPGYYLGGWCKNGIVYLDISSHNSDLWQALRESAYNNQIAIYDLGNKCDITLPPGYITHFESI